MLIRVCVAGITGWTGPPIAAAVAAADDLQLVTGVSRSASGAEIAGTPVFASIGEALDAAPADVLVTSPGWPFRTSAPLRVTTR